MGVLARILPGARDAALWRNYEREFVAVKKKDRRRACSKEFRKAYERQLREKNRPCVVWGSVHC